MLAVIFVTANGDQYDAEAEPGTSLMQAAVNNGIDGILAECGGACACATCHCYIDESWIELTGEPDQLESSMLEQVLDGQSNSRLSCQITLTDAMNGMVVRLPKSQY